jgi:hypothetical protein
MCTFEWNLPRIRNQDKDQQELKDKSKVCIYVSLCNNSQFSSDICLLGNNGAGAMAGNYIYVNMYICNCFATPILELFRDQQDNPQASSNRMKETGWKTQQQQILMCRITGHIVLSFFFFSTLDSRHHLLAMLYVAVIVVLLALLCWFLF